MWHLPLIFDEERDIPIGRLCNISVARCARISYLTHHGTRDIEQDLDLCNRLLRPTGNVNDPSHMSPFEHVAKATDTPEKYFGNFRGWEQYRKMILGENIKEFIWKV